MASDWLWYIAAAIGGAEACLDIVYYCPGYETGAYTINIGNLEFAL